MEKENLKTMEEEVNYLADWDDIYPDQAVELGKYIDWLLKTSDKYKRKCKEGLISEEEKDIYLDLLGEKMRETGDCRYWDQINPLDWSTLEIPPDETFNLMALKRDDTFNFMALKSDPLWCANRHYFIENK